MSDGPVGARGTRFDGPASLDVPCSTALAATWEPDLVERIGQVLGRETKAKGAGVLLAPTVNLHRTPTGGRNFECMSEDPYLTSRIAVGYVQGLQSEGVAACVKHFVGNDTEFERMSIDSQIDERTLRELYLVPFEAVVKEAGVLAVMTAYNRINGPFAADSEPMLRGVLRGEWGFDGLVMSDWFGLHSTTEALAAGLDLEMPGPTRCRGQALIDAVERGDVSVELVRGAALNVLTLMDRVGTLAGEGPGPELTRDDPDDRALIRLAGAKGMVLLRNVPDASGAADVAARGGRTATGGRDRPERGVRPDHGWGQRPRHPDARQPPARGDRRTVATARRRRHPRRGVQHQSKASRARPPAVRAGHGRLLRRSRRARSSGRRTGPDQHHRHGADQVGGRPRRSRRRQP